MAYDEALADRIRDRLGDTPGVAEKKMFGGLAFLTEGHMAVCIRHDDLMARIGPAGVEAALERQGASRLDMGGRPMRGWILVAGEALDDDVLDTWLADAKAFVATLPPK